MNGRTILGIVLALVLVGGAAALGVSIYNAGIAQGAAQAAAASGTVTTPIVVPAYGYGWGWGGPGFGFGGLIFGFLGFLLILFLLGGIFRAFAHRGRGWDGRGGWGGHGGYGGSGHGPDSFRGSPWETRAREIHDEWHRRADEPAGAAGTGQETPRPVG